MPCATFVQTKGNNEVDKPPNHTLEDVAEEMLNGIFCHYEPPNPKEFSERQKRNQKADKNGKKRGGILRAPGKMFGRRGKKNKRKKDAADQKVVRWSDTSDEEEEAARKKALAAKSAEEDEEEDLLPPIEIQCYPGNTCIEVGIEAGCVSPSAMEKLKQRSGGAAEDGEDDDEDFNIPLPPPRKKTPQKMMSRKAMMTAYDDDEDKGNEGGKASGKKIKKKQDGGDDNDLVFDEEGNPRSQSKSGGTSNGDSQPPPPPPPPPPQSDEKYVPQLQGVKINLKEDDEDLERLARSSREGPPSKDSQRYRPKQDYDEIDNSIIEAGSGSGGSDNSSDELVKRIEMKKGHSYDDNDETGSAVSSTASSLFRRVWPRRRGGRIRSESPSKRRNSDKDTDPVDQARKQQERGRSRKKDLHDSDWDESIPIIPTNNAEGRRRSTGDRGRGDRDPSPGPIRPSRSRSADAHEERLSGRRPVLRSASPSLRTRSRLHPAHPLARDPDVYGSHDDAERLSYITAHRHAFNDDAMDRQSYITAHRQSFDGASSVGSGASAIKYYNPRDDQMERQSYITAHRHSFEPPLSRHPQMIRRQPSQQRLPAVPRGRSPSPSRRVLRGRSRSPAGRAVRNQRRGQSLEREQRNVQRLQPKQAQTISQRRLQQQRALMQQQQLRRQRVAQNRQQPIPKQQRMMKQQRPPVQQILPAQYLQQRASPPLQRAPSQPPTQIAQKKQQQPQFQQQYQPQQQMAPLPQMQQQPIQQQYMPQTAQQQFQQQLPMMQQQQAQQQPVQQQPVQQQPPPQQQQVQQSPAEQQPAPRPVALPPSQQEAAKSGQQQQQQQCSFSPFAFPQQGCFPSQTQSWVPDYQNFITPEQQKAWFEYQQACSMATPQEQNISWPQMQMPSYSGQCPVPSYSGQCPVDFPMQTQQGSQPMPQMQMQQQQQQQQLQQSQTPQMQMHQQQPAGQGIPMQRSSQSAPNQGTPPQIQLQRSAQSLPNSQSWNANGSVQASPSNESSSSGKPKKKGWGFFRKNKAPTSPGHQQKQKQQQQQQQPQPQPQLAQPYGQPTPVQRILPDIPRNQRSLPPQPQMKILPMTRNQTPPQQQQQQQQQGFRSPPQQQIAMQQSDDGTARTESTESTMRKIPDVLPRNSDSGDSSDSNRTVDPVNVHPPTPKKPESSMLPSWLPGLTYPTTDPVSIHAKQKDPPRVDTATNPDPRTETTPKTGSNSPEPSVQLEQEPSWEERTRQAWEKLRSGFFEAPIEEESTKSAPQASANQSSDKPMVTSTKETAQQQMAEKPKTNPQPQQERQAAPSPAPETVLPGYYHVPAPEQPRPEPVILPEPTTQGILKQSSYDRRVRFTSPRRQIYHDELYDVGQDNLSPKKRRVLRGKKLFGGLFGRGNGNNDTNNNDKNLILTSTKSTEGSWDSAGGNNYDGTNDQRQPQDHREAPSGVQMFIPNSMNDQREPPPPAPQSNYPHHMCDPNSCYDQTCHRPPQSPGCPITM